MKEQALLPPPVPRSSHKIIRIVGARPRLFICAGFGLAVIAVLLAAFEGRVVTKLLLGWNVGIALYLVLVLQLMRRSDVHRIRRRAALQDESQIAFLVLVVAAAAASLASIFFELGTANGQTRSSGQLILATTTIVLSWAFIHTMFALHYAHEFYGDGRDHIIGGLSFPDDQEPDYWDFMYFSFVIGMCAQVSDVTISSKSIRRTVLTHSIVSFLFNAALLALTVNIAASAI